MIKWFKHKQEVIFLSVSVLFLLIVLTYVIRSVGFLSSGLGAAISPGNLLSGAEPVNFNLEKFENLGIELQQ